MVLQCLRPMRLRFYSTKLENGPLAQHIDKFSFNCRYMYDKFNYHTDRIKTLKEFKEVHPSIVFTYDEGNR